MLGLLIVEWLDAARKFKDESNKESQRYGGWATPPYSYMQAKEELDKKEEQVFDKIKTLLMGVG